MLFLLGWLPVQCASNSCAADGLLEAVAGFKHSAVWTSVLSRAIGLLHLDKSWITWTSFSW